MSFQTYKTQTQITIFLMKSESFLTLHRKQQNYIYITFDIFVI